MKATVSFALGILLATIVLVVARRRKPEVSGPAPKPTTLGWWTLAFGLTAVTAFSIAQWLTPSGNIPGLGLWLISIAFALATVLVGVGALVRRDRHWLTWVGLFTGLAPAVFWIAFEAGNLPGFGE
jgi:drug/metabolite transporter (DMT)-like permease